MLFLLNLIVANGDDCGFEVFVNAINTKVYNKICPSTYFQFELGACFYNGITTLILLPHGWIFLPKVYTKLVPQDN